MKRIKKLLIYVLTIAMVLSSCTPAFAANTNAAQASIRLNKHELNLYSDYSGTKKLKATVHGADRTVTWLTSDEAVATVDAGKVSVKGAGEAVITASANGVKDDCSVKVTQSSVSLNAAAVTLSTRGKGRFYKLIPEVVGTKKKVKWTSSDKSVAVVSRGKIRAKKEGTATITATANGLTATCEVTVIKDLLLFDDQAVTVYPEDTLKLKTNAVKNSTVVYASSNTDVVTVDETGKITAVAVGAADVTATVEAQTATCKVTVAPEDLILSESRVSLSKEAGHKNIKIKAEVKGHDKKVNWSSADETVAKVSSKGKIQAKGYGVTTVTASANGIAKTVEVRVQKSVKLPRGYKLVWADEFDGDALDTENWNYEEHAAGWVNNELQTYVAGDSNVKVADGLLTIKAEKDGETITSGRINTQNKQDFKYGRYVASIKVPEGNGFWPAFWMMPTDESLYGQWPKCGEIDIMEIPGHEAATTQSTIHYGEPHAQQKFNKTLENGTFADAFHEYAVDWQPGKITYYVDGEVLGTMDDWYSKREGMDAVTYPAPFDQPFYMILNLAVGGDMAVDPDETTDFNKGLQVDYVRVYQNKKGYNENVKKPNKEVKFREADSTGNFIINGDFSKKELGEDKAWNQLFAAGGKGSAEIKDNELIIKTENYGTEDHSVQTVQPGLPAKKGLQYKVTFDAYAEAARTMKVAVTAPDISYQRYLNDTVVDLTTTKQTFTYTFNMAKDSDANARLEFNLGNQGSKATVKISNVRYEVSGGEEVTDESPKSVLPDGNYVYNGGFDRGADRMKYWELVQPTKKATASVEKDGNETTLKVSSKKRTIKPEDAVITQKDLGIIGKKDLRFSFTAYADAERTITAKVAGKSFDVALTKEPQTFEFEFTTDESLNRTDLQFLVGYKGATYIDNVDIRDNTLILNGDFSAGETGFTVFVDNSASASHGIDTLTYDSAMAIDVKNTSDADWKIQLIQDGVKLEKGKWYKLTFDALSTKDRKIKSAFQHNGSDDNNWTPYSGEKVYNLTSEFATFEEVFQMKAASDSASRYSISLGAVNGTAISTPHTVVVDNIKLEETEEPEPDPVSSDELIKNGDFSSGDDNFSVYVDGSASASHEVKEVEGNPAMTFTINNTSDADWKIQLIQDGVKVENGKWYKLSFDAKSSADRKIKSAIQHNGSADDDWSVYSGQKVYNLTSEFNTFEEVFKMASDTDTAARFSINLGAVNGNVISTAHTVVFDNIKLVETEEPAPEPGDDDEKIGVELIADRSFENFGENWSSYVHTGSDKEKLGAIATVSANSVNAEVVISVERAGWANWNVQLKQANLSNIVKGGKYVISYDVVSTVDRQVEHSLMGSGDKWIGGEHVDLTAGTSKHEEQYFVISEDFTGPVTLVMSFGEMGEYGSTPAGTIRVKNISLKRVAND